jgi:hypothetical protein
MWKGRVVGGIVRKILMRSEREGGSGRAGCEEKEGLREGAKLKLV